MRLDSVRELKTILIESVIEPLATSVVSRAVLGVPAQPMAALSRRSPTMALGVSRKGRDDYVLAVRIQKRALENSPQLEAIRKQAKGEVDVRYIGRVAKLAGKPWQQKRHRPLRIGGSIGHSKITAGTLGCFVRESGDGPVMILSNNHVLANENRGKKGDPVLQPATFDDGKDPEDRVATLTSLIRLNRIKPNLTDCAVAALDSDIKYNAKTLTGLGSLTGLSDALLEDDAAVGKVGRTTELTRGRVVSSELDYILIDYDSGTLRFDQQIEIEGEGTKPFSRGGDSGSLIVDSEVHGIGLLFACSDLGGTNGLGLTYANPLRTVLEALMVSLVLK